MKNIFLMCLITTTLLAQQKDFKIDALVSPQIRETIITVGDNYADIGGFTNQTIQAAINTLPKTGGTVKLTKGTFTIIAPVRMSSNVKLVGSGEETILKIGNGFSSPMVVDADYAELKVTVQDASGFKVGMAVQIRDDRKSSCWDVSTACITDIKDNTVYIDSYLIRDYSTNDNLVLSNPTSAVSAVGVENCTISDFTIDGNREQTQPMDGCNGAGVFAKKAKNILIDNVRVKNYNGEGISWQITENVTVQNCEISGCRNNGMHPGTGSPKTRILNNNVHDNDVDGLFICWRVQHGLVQGNTFYHNGRYGICTGHKDTDVLFENNHIYENGSDGFHFRYEQAKNAPHNNKLINNIIENNDGAGISFNSPAKNIILQENTIRDTKGMQKAALKFYKNSLPVELKNNKMSGDIIDEREK